MVSSYKPAADVAVIATHVAPATGFGGIAESVGRLAESWAAGGRSFSLCASNASSLKPLEAGDLALPAWVPVHLYACRHLKHLGFGWGGVLAVYRACRDARVVYINGLATWPTSLAKLFCVLLGRPMLVAPHSGLMRPYLALVRTRKPFKWLFYRLAELPLLRRAKAVHVTSALEAEGMESLLPGLPVHLAPNGLDLGAWKALPARRPDGGLALCYIGRFSPEKGILRFLRLWKAVRGPQDTLLIAGSGSGAYAQAVEAEAGACPDAIQLEGYLDREGVRSVLLRSDMLVLPSGIEDGDLRENFGNVVAEALASERPVMVRAGLAWDMAEREGFGLLFDATDRGISQAIARAGQLPPEQRAAMGAAGRRYAQAHFDLAQLAERLWRVAYSLKSP